MTPRDVFETHFRSAEMLLRVHRLLEADGGPQRDHRLVPELRRILTCTDNEELIVLLNQLFLGVVRERAEMNLAFFRKESLDLLLRQAVVAACSSLDVIMPHLLETYLPTVVRIRQRNFLPNDNEVRDLFRQFSLRLDDLWQMAEEDNRVARWDILSRRVLDYCGSRSLSNEPGIAATLALLGVEKPWEKIAARAGESESSLRQRIRRAIARRNDIVHRADRPRTDPHGLPQHIDAVWTQNHIGAIRVVGLACCDLAHERVSELGAATVEPVEV